MKHFCSPSENKWGLVRRLRKGSSFVSKARRSDADTKPQLFGRLLCKICPDERSLPKPVAVSQVSVLNVTSIISTHPLAS